MLGGDCSVIGGPVQARSSTAGADPGCVGPARRIVARAAKSRSEAVEFLRDGHSGKLPADFRKARNEIDWAARVPPRPLHPSVCGVGAQNWPVRLSLRALINAMKAPGYAKS